MEMVKKIYIKIYSAVFSKDRTVVQRRQGTLSSEESKFKILKMAELTEVTVLHISFHTGIRSVAD